MVHTIWDRQNPPLIYLLMVKPWHEGDMVILKQFN